MTIISTSTLTSAAAATAAHAFAHDTTMTLESDEHEHEHARAFTYAPPDADTLFPMPDVSSHALASWKSSPMTHAVIALIHRMRHDELSAGYRGNEDQFLLRKGRVEAFDRLLGEIDQLEAEILHASTEPALDYDASVEGEGDDIDVLGTLDDDE